MYNKQLLFSFEHKVVVLDNLSASTPDLFEMCNTIVTRPKGALLL